MEQRFCPVCATRLLHTAAMQDDEYVCAECGYSGDGSGKGRAGRRRARQREALVVKAIVAELRARGETVLRVGQYRADMAGSDPGVPDLLVNIQGSLWLGLEVKSPGNTSPSRLTPAQRELRSARMIVVVDSVEAAVDEVGRAKKDAVAGRGDHADDP